MAISFKSVWNGVKAVIRNLPVVRQEIVSAVTAGVTMVGVFEVTFPQISTPHLAFFATLTSILVGIAAFLSNNKVVSDLQSFSDQPVWKAKLKLLAGKKC